MSNIAQYQCPIVFCPDEQILAWAAGPQLVVVDWPSRKLLQVDNTKGHSELAVRAVSIFGSHIFTAGEDKKLICWAKKGDAEWHPLRVYTHPKKIMTLHVDEHILFGDKFGEYYMFVTEMFLNNGSELPSPVFGHMSTTTAALVDRERDVVISADRDEKIRVAGYSSQGSNIIEFLFGHKRYVSHLLGVSGTRVGNGMQVISVGADGKVLLWDSVGCGAKIAWTTDLADNENGWCIINAVAVLNGSSRRVLIAKANSPDEIVVIGAENGIIEKTIKFPNEVNIQALWVSPEEEIFCVDTFSHLRSISGSNDIALPENVPAIPIEMMKLVHHENLPDEPATSIRKKIKANEEH